MSEIKSISYSLKKEHLPSIKIYGGEKYESYPIQFLIKYNKKEAFMKHLTLSRYTLILWKYIIEFNTINDKSIKLEVDNISKLLGCAAATIKRSIYELVFYGFLCNDIRKHYYYVNNNLVFV